MGLPIADLARANGSRVLLNGLGGDQWLCGSELCYAEAIAGRRGQELLEILREDFRALGMRAVLWRFMRFGIVPLLSEGTQRAMRTGYAILRRTSDAGKPDWLAGPMRSRIEARERRSRQDSLQKVGRVAQHQQLACLNDAYQRMAIEVHERLCAQTGLELRQPFWTARIIEFALATPERTRLRGQEDKWLHRHAMEGLLPEDVLQRSSKAEFSVTFARCWADLDPHLTGTVLPRRQGWVQAQSIRSMLKACSQPNPWDWPSMAMWSLWTLFGVDAACCPECGSQYAAHNVNAVEVVQR
jgi:asparagine synthase (glutamine-hydrolysing)